MQTLLKPFQSKFWGIIAFVGFARINLASHIDDVSWILSIAFDYNISWDSLLCVGVDIGVRVELKNE
jgi:hypothetical protein